MSGMRLPLSFRHEQLPRQKVKWHLVRKECHTVRSWTVTGGHITCSAHLCSSTLSCVKFRRTIYSGEGKVKSK